MLSHIRGLLTATVEYIVVFISFAATGNLNHPCDAVNCVKKFAPEYVSTVGVSGYMNGISCVPPSPHYFTLITTFRWSSGHTRLILGSAGEQSVICGGTLADLYSEDVSFLVAGVFN